MPILQLKKEDIEEVAKIKNTLIPHLTKLRSLVKEEEFSHETTRNLNVLAGKISGQSAIFKTAYLGVIGIASENINTFLEFKEIPHFEDPTNLRAWATRQDEIITKSSLLEKGFGLSLPKLKAYTEGFQNEIKNDAEKDKLCKDVLADLSKMETELEKLRKKFLSNNDEKQSSQPSPGNN